MCDRWRKESSNELILPEIEGIFSSYRGFKVVGITRGEPTLRRDLADIMHIINMCQPKLKRMFLTTNGFLPEKCLHDVKEFLELQDEYGKKCLLTVLVSVDGPKCLHNHIRGVASAYERATTTLKCIVKLRENYNNLIVGDIATYSPFNYRFYDEVLEELNTLADKYGLENAVCVVWTGNLYDSVGLKFEWDYLEALPLKWASEIKKALRKYSSQLIDARCLFFDMAKPFVRNPKKQVIPCGGARIRYFMNPYGEIYPCVVWERKIGDLRANGYDLNAIFASEERKAIRKEIEEHKCPICFLTCELIPSMMASPLKTLWRKFWEWV